MPCSIIEIEQQILQVTHRLTPDERIDQAPDEEGNEDPYGPPTEELAGRVVERELQETGGHHEKCNGGSCKYAESGHPEGIGFRKDERSFAAEIERLRAMGHHDHKAGHQPHPVYPDLSIFRLHINICFVKDTLFF